MSTYPLMNGALAPAFSATSYDGRRVDLARYLERHHVLLVFLRGLACPYCRSHLARLSQAYPRLVEKDAEVIAIAPDPADELARFFTEKRIPFPGIPDHDHAIADTYGQRTVWWKLGRMPAQFLIARGRGTIRFAEYGGSMRDITPPEKVEALLDELAGTA